MFTGIVQSLGRVVSRTGSELVVSAGSTFAPDPLQTGESIAVNGVCLTLLPGSESESMRFEVSPETFARTSLGTLRDGSAVNLERAMSVSGRLGGHIVQGHVDASGILVSRRSEGEFQVLRFQAPPEYDRLLIDKGSIAVDGVSLTVVRPENGVFDVWLVPHTLDNTNLGSLAPGDSVNLEFDVLGKYVEKLLTSSLAIAARPIEQSRTPELPLT